MIDIKLRFVFSQLFISGIEVLTVGSQNMWLEQQSGPANSNFIVQFYAKQIVTPSSSVCLPPLPSSSFPIQLASQKEEWFYCFMCILVLWACLLYLLHIEVQNTDPTSKVSSVFIVILTTSTTEGYDLVFRL